MPRGMVVLLVSLFVACSSATKIIRLDTGQGEPSVHIPRGNVEPAKVGDDEFKKAVARHALVVPTPEQPLVFARELLGVPERSGWYRYERKSRRLFPLGAENELKLELSAADSELNRLYNLWCGRAWGPPPRDCLRLLVDSPVLDGDGKYALAMAIARGGDDLQDARPGDRGQRDRFPLRTAARSSLFERFARRDGRSPHDRKPAFQEDHFQP